MQHMKKAKNQYRAGNSKVLPAQNGFNKTRHQDMVNLLSTEHLKVLPDHWAGLV